MARIRTIKPEFWTDEKIVECSFEARLMFIGMFNFADDKGNLVRSPKRIKMQIFPADMIDCEPLIKELSLAGLISEYSVNGVEYIHIDGFSKHQKINRPSATTIPTPEEVADSSRKPAPNYMDGSVNDDEKQTYDSHASNGVNTEDSLSAHGELTDGRERKGREEERNKTNLSDSNRTDGDKPDESKGQPAQGKPDSESADAEGPDPVDVAFENIFWGAGLRKDAKVKAKSAFRTKYRDWKKANRGTPDNFAVMLAEDISLRVKAQQMGFDKLLPASYLNGERWNDEKPNVAPQISASANAVGGTGASWFAKPSDGSAEVFISQAAIDRMKRGANRP
ncbi:hypothetical protein [Enterobacter hormaechei]|uniref:hypothetical protein n=1 Tax=Enterobacter hormaechei TaxID=158836 RepID=UPI002115A400|nr:hypothetical protein [Enterobacter hormaechei]